MTATGTIIKKTATGYLVQTASGRTIPAESSQPWPIGAGVTVIDGRIVGVAGRPQPSKIYEV